MTYRLTNAFIEYTLCQYYNIIACWFVDYLANVDFALFVDFVDFDYLGRPVSVNKLLH